MVQVPDVAAALAAAAIPPADAPVPEKCFIIGGAKTYERTIASADKLYITHVRTFVPDADAFFPAIDPATWHKDSETPLETDPENGLQYSFAVYVRKA